MATRLTDGNRVMRFEMWEENIFTMFTGIDFSNDFFEVGSLFYDEATNAYMVGDLEYCVEQMRDWMSYSGDYYYDSQDDGTFRLGSAVEVE